MSARQRIVRVRRNYNQWVANQTLEDYALRFTAKSARKWSAAGVANTAIGAISFLALEAIGGAITVSYGFTNAFLAILVVSILIFATSVPIAVYAARYGVDIDLLTRGAGFGYIGSTITSLIYASFTFLFFAIEAAIMSVALELCFGVPLALGYLISSIVVIPLVTHGITLISRFQRWTQAAWLVLHAVPFIFVIAKSGTTLEDWTTFKGLQGNGGFDLVLFGMAATVIFSLVAQIGEQVDFLRFMPPREQENRRTWWLWLLAGGPGWIIGGAIKLLAGSFLAFLAVQHMIPPDKAAEPTQMYLLAFGYVFSTPEVALAFTGAFVIISQLKINVTNSYAGSIAWSNFFSRLTHSHPGRVVWLVFNVAIALILMELGVYRGLEHILGFYSLVAVAWIGALVSDLVINKPLGLSPPFIEFKRAHLYDINPVGVGSMVIAAASAIIAHGGMFGTTLQALSPFVALAVAFITSPMIAWATDGRYYIAREARRSWNGAERIKCVICEYSFEPEDMAACPVYAGAICSLCCSLDARCHDSCKRDARFADQVMSVLGATLPNSIVAKVNSRLGHYLGIMLILSLVIGAVLALIYVQATLDPDAPREIIRSTLWMAFCILLIITGVAAWLLVLAQESRRVAQEESHRQTALLMQEIEAHRVTDIKLQKAKEAAEAANEAKSRYVGSISHELRSPLNAILGYAQLLERDKSIPPHRQNAVRVVRRSSEHLSGLIDGLLDIAQIESGRFQLNRDEVRLGELLDQIVAMFRLQASGKHLDFIFARPERLPEAVLTDEKRLRQILINLLANAIKFTDTGQVALRIRYGGEVAEIEISDTGIGIAQSDVERIFQPFERGQSARDAGAPGVGLGLTITKLLIKIMGGDLSVTSEVGRGSTFRFKLLLSPITPSRRPAESEQRIYGYRGPRLTVLCADDDADHCALVRETLSPLGFIVLTAQSGEACLALADECTPDIVLLDVSMPGISGLETAVQLRAAGHACKIIMVSANPPDAARQLESPQLYDAYVMKPIVLDELLGTIASARKLEWLREQIDAHSLLPSAARAQSDRIQPHLRDSLLRLGQLGHVRAIHMELDAINAHHPESADLVTRLRSLILAFDLKQFNSILEELAHDAARN